MLSDDFMESVPALLANAAAEDVAAAVMSMCNAEPLSRFLAWLCNIRPFLFRGSFVPRHRVRNAHNLELVLCVEADLALVVNGEPLPRSKQRNKEEACSRGFANLPSPAEADFDLSHARRLKSFSRRSHPLP